MAIAVGATSKGRNASATSVASAGVATQATGSTFVVGVIWATGASFTSFVDNKSNTYTQIGVDREVTAADGTHCRWYRCENGAGGAGHTATLTISAAVALSVFFLEITGAATASFDQQNSQTDAASPFTSASITTTQAAEMLVSYIVGNSGSNPATNAESTGFTIQAGAEETNGASFWTGCIATRIVAATGTYNSSFTETGSTSAAVFIASFKESLAVSMPIAWVTA